MPFPGYTCSDSNLAIRSENYLFQKTNYVYGRGRIDTTKRWGDEVEVELKLLLITNGVIRCPCMSQLHKHA